MSGAEHFAEAERLLKIAEEEMRAYAGTRDEKVEAYHVAQATWAQQRAQVHATLAHSSATERLANALEDLPTYEGMLSVYAFGANGR